MAMDGVASSLVMAIGMTMALIAAAQMASTILLWSTHPTEARLAFGFWSPVLTLIAGLPLFALSLLLTLTPVGWWPALVCLGLVGWATGLLARAIESRRLARQATESPMYRRQSIRYAHSELEAQVRLAARLRENASSLRGG